MKKLTAFFLVLCTFMSLLCSCDKQTPISTSTNETTAEQTSTTTTSTTTASKVHSITLIDKNALLGSALSGGYKSGDIVEFQTGWFEGLTVECYVNGELLAEGEPISEDRMHFQFVMPDTDVTLEIKHTVDQLETYCVNLVGTANVIESQFKKGYLIGEEVVFHIEQTQGTATECYLNRKPLSPTLTGNTATYRFQMPDHNVFLEVITRDIKNATGDTEYTVTVTGNGFLSSPYKDRYLPGEEVILRTDLIYDVAISCYMNGEKLEHQLVNTGIRHTHLEYRFIMPDTDVIFEIQTWGVRPPAA